ncbi:hypothetical protein FB45DRAFT_1103494 [Roridomyces roridus]|uniref:SAP domain-containing protein n=1 Tax=Roridomyces roridus TaxID=1738132 RepID=A0AAD7BDX5_9AGAR|nr:hypothetical protein FB45DRAFT_1103494 [Roridomyces roridus]
MASVRLTQERNALAVEKDRIEREYRSLRSRFEYEVNALLGHNLRQQAAALGAEIRGLRKENDVLRARNAWYVAHRQGSSSDVAQGVLEVELEARNTELEAEKKELERKLGLSLAEGHQLTGMSTGRKQVDEAFQRFPLTVYDYDKAISTSSAQLSTLFCMPCNTIGVAYKVPLETKPADLLEHSETAHPDMSELTCVAWLAPPPGGGSDATAVIDGGSDGAFHRFAVAVFLVLLLLGLLSLFDLTAALFVSAFRPYSTGLTGGSGEASVLSDMPKEVSGGARSLPFPRIGSYGVQVAGEWEIEHISLAVSNRQLSELCDRFKLARSGNKSELTARLTKFSSNQSQDWNSCVPSQQHFLEDGAVRPQAEYTSSVDGQSQHVLTKRELIRNWSSNITSKYPFKPIPPPERERGIYNAASQVSTASTGAGQSEISATTTREGIVSQFLEFLDGHDMTISATPSSTPSANVSAPHSSSVSALTVNFSYHPTATISHVQHIPTSPQLPAQVFSVSAPLPHLYVHPANTQIPVAVPSAVSSAPASWRSVLLADGREVGCLTSNLPDPPLFSIADDPERILDIWDDRLPTWKGMSPLSIDGIPIPLVYWGKLYKHSKNLRWHGTRGSWFQWKVLVEAMTATTLEQFWVRFSAPDKTGVVQRLSLTRIQSVLTAERKAEDARLAVLAKAEIPPSRLMYRKGSEWKPYQKNDALARIYRQFKGCNLEDSDDSD